MFPLLIGAGISAVAGLIGAKKQSDASKDAARIQSHAANRVAGMSTAAGEQAATAVTAAGTQAAEGVVAASEGAATGLEDAAAGAQQGVYDARDDANTTLRSVYDEQLGMVDPYQQAGVDALGQLQAGADEEFQFSEDDPSYQWRLQQGQQAIERSAAARGGINSGGTLKALTRYAQGAASTEYGAAFDRFQRSRDTRLRTLSGLAGLGSTANTQAIAAGNNFGNAYSDNMTDAARVYGGFGVMGAEGAGRFRTGGAESAGRFTLGSVGDAGRFRLEGTQQAADAITGGANARAAGQVGSANAWNSGLGAVGNAAQGVSNYYALKDIVQAPRREAISDNEEISDNEAAWNAASP